MAFPKLALHAPARVVRRVGPLAAAVAASVGAIVALAVRSVGAGARTARQGWERRPGASTAALRARAREPLLNLYDVHPEALNAAPRELGLRTIPTSEIRGTAVQGPQQRGGDFLPLPPFRSRNWSARWQRIRSATESLAVLPPIEVVKYGDGYWVTDGHNRVAAANYYGQVGVDALVTELRRPGGRFEAAQPGMAAVLGEGRALRAAGQGRLASTTAFPSRETQVDPNAALIHDETAPSHVNHSHGPGTHRDGRLDEDTDRSSPASEPSREDPPSS